MSYLTHFRLNIFSHSLYRKNFNFRYVGLCDLDISREKLAKLFANSGDPDQTSFCGVWSGNAPFVGCHFGSFQTDLGLIKYFQVHFPDTEFFINLGDWPLEKRKINEGPLPMFSWCGSEDSRDIVMPTYDLTESTLEMMSRFGWLISVMGTVCTFRGSNSIKIDFTLFQRGLQILLFFFSANIVQIVAHLTADPGWRRELSCMHVQLVIRRLWGRSRPGWQHSFMEIDHEM